MWQSKYSIHISYSESDQQYVASVIDLPDCVGYGWSYAAALAAVEYRLLKHLQANASNLLSANSTRRNDEPVQGPQGRAMQILRAKFGKVTISDLCERFGNGCPLSAFNSALNGKGSRDIRVLIALAAEMRPSELWPHRAFKTRRADDQEYVKKKLGLSDNFLRRNIPDIGASRRKSSSAKGGYTSSTGS